MLCLTLLTKVPVSHCITLNNNYKLYKKKLSGNRKTFTDQRMSKYGISSYGSPVKYSGSTSDFKKLLELELSLLALFFKILLSLRQYRISNINIFDVLY